MEYNLDIITNKYSSKEAKIKVFNSLLEYLSLDFAEWIDINGIRNGKHKWKYKGDNYTGRYTTKEMFNIWRKIHQKNHKNGKIRNFKKNQFNN